MVYCLAVILICVFLFYKLWQIKCVLLTMQLLFMIIDMFKLLISIVMPLLV